MGWIGVALRQHDPTRKRADFPCGSCVTRALGEPIEETEQMTAPVQAGAVSHKEVDWHAINWQKAHTIVRRLQARIVKATQVGR
jgi:RNA-directed DNA polymerase